MQVEDPFYRLVPSQAHICPQDLRFRFIEGRASILRRGIATDHYPRKLRRDT